MVAKGDGVDVVPGLGESVYSEWSGDVDLNDGGAMKSIFNIIEKIGQREMVTLHPDITTLEYTGEHLTTSCPTNHMML